MIFKQKSHNLLNFGGFEGFLFQSRVGKGKITQMSICLAKYTIFGPYKEFFCKDDP